MAPVPLLVELPSRILLTRFISRRVQRPTKTWKKNPRLSERSNKRRHIARRTSISNFVNSLSLAARSATIHQGRPGNKTPGSNVRTSSSKLLIELPAPYFADSLSLAASSAIDGDLETNIRFERSNKPTCTARRTSMSPFCQLAFSRDAFSDQKRHRKRKHRVRTFDQAQISNFNPLSLGQQRGGRTSSTPTPLQNLIQ